MTRSIIKNPLILLLGILVSRCSADNKDPDLIRPFFFSENEIGMNPTAPISVSAGLAAYYPFDGTTNDASGNGNRGIVRGATLAADRNNVSDRAYAFSGYNNGNVIAVSNTSSLRLNQQASMSFWMYLGDYSGMDGNGKFTSYGYQALIAKDGDRGGFYAGLKGDVSRNKVVLNFTNSPADCRTDLPGNLQANLNRWVHIGITVSSDAIKLYYGGSLIKSQPLSTPVNFSDANSRDLYLGQYGFSTSVAPNGWYPFNGKLDEVRLYNRTLTDTEVQQLASL